MTFTEFASSPLGATLVIGAIAMIWKFVPGVGDKAEQAADAEIEKSPFFQKHPGFKNGFEYVIHLLKLGTLSVGQTYVDALKQDGKFDAAAAQVAKQKAIDFAKSTMSAEGREQFLSELGLTADQAHKADETLSHLVEAIIADRNAHKSALQTSVDAAGAAVQAFLGAGGAVAPAAAVNPAAPAPAPVAAPLA